MSFDANFILAVGANLVVVGVAWGTLNARVSALEKAVSALSDLQVTVTRIETRQDGLIEQVKDLNSSIRWMREPAAAVYAPGAASGLGGGGLGGGARKGG